MSALLCALAAVWLAAAVHLFGDPCGPAALLPALMLGAGAAALRRSGSVVPAQVALGAALAGALLMHFFFPPVELPFARLAGYEPEVRGTESGPVGVHSRYAHVSESERAPTFGWQSASDLVPTTKSSACGADNFCEAKAKEWRAAPQAVVNFEIERSSL